MHGDLMIGEIIHVVGLYSFYGKLINLEDKCEMDYLQPRAKEFSVDNVLYFLLGECESLGWNSCVICVHLVQTQVAPSPLLSCDRKEEV